MNKVEKENKILFIDRKKSTPIFTTFYAKFTKFLLAKNYKEEKILYRIIYDKLYRPELYNFILKGANRNINLARNIFIQNEDKYEFNLLKPNDEFSFDDDEMYSENNYIHNLYKRYAIHKATIYSSVPLGAASVFFKFINKSSNLFNFTLVLSGCVFVVNWLNFEKKEKIYKSELQNILMEANKINLELYRKFYYD